ncbi:MAG TPA: putative quinol monooxygenase [Thermomicrobiales bacterium]|nr:putative quinol monooxygenase [Thermomicrobiales bacterium]
MFVVVVLCQVKPDQVEAFVEASLDDARHSVLDEPDCLRFDLVQDDEDPTKIWLYEVYQDRAAFDHHLTTTHLHRWRAAVKDLFAEPPQASIGHSVFLSEEARD